MLKVYITNPIPKIGIDLLKNNGFRCDVNESGRDLTDDGLKKVVGDYDAIISFLSNKIDSKIIDYASRKLKVIANYAVGFDNVDLDAAKARNIIVCNTPGVAGESVAEHTFALILGLNKKLLEQGRFVREGKYKKWDPNLFLSHQLWGQTIGIIGLGRIGSYVAQIAHNGFRMKILYYDVKRSEDFEILTEAEFSPISEILKQADIITLHCPLNDKTKKLISREELKVMKKTAIIINTARGPIIDEGALVWALENGEIAGAGLDVFENEPEISKELIKNDKVLLTPHTASGTFETRENMARIAAENIIAVFAGEEPYGLVKS